MKYVVKLKKIIEKSVVMEAENDEQADRLLLDGKYDFITSRVISRDDYIGCEYVSDEKTQTVITSEDDLKAYCDTKDMERYLFKYTDCGCGYRSTDDYIAVNGYAEGSGDAECPEHRLYFPFTIEQWHETLKTADEEGCELWHEYNDEEEIS